MAGNRDQGPGGFRQRMAFHLITTAFGCMLLAGCGGGSGQTTTGTDLANRSFSFWPPLPHEPRIQFLRTYRYTSDVEPPQSGLDRMVFGSEQVVLPIESPYGVAMWNGRIYVCDIGNPGIVILDLRERETRLMGVTGNDPMRQPIDLAIAPEGRKYVVDRALERIFVFDANDRHVASFDPEGAVPVGVAVRGDELLVADFASQTVLILDRLTGDVKGSVGAPYTSEAEIAGHGGGKFVRPLGIAAGPSGDLFVTDVIRGSLQRFDGEGTFVKVIADTGDAAGKFVRPKHLEVDGKGLIFVVDAAFQNVQMFDAEGAVLMYFGSPGSHEGSMSLPAGIDVHEGDLDLFEQYLHPAFQAEQLVLVTNQWGPQKVSVYAMGHLKEGYTVDDIAPQAATVETGLWTGEEDPLRQPDNDGARNQEEGEGQSGSPGPQPSQEQDDAPQDTDQPEFIPLG